MARDGKPMLVGAAVAAGASVFLWRRRRAHAASAVPIETPPSSVVAQEPGGVPLFDFGRPVASTVRALVTSGWSRPRDHGAHRALDIRLRVGTPVLAIDDGVVIRVQKTDAGDAGLWVGVRHASGVASRYLHFSETRVEKGQTVRRGDVLGLSGDTGNSQAPHLHLVIHVPASMLPLVERAIGVPRPGWGPSVGTYGHAIPGEPFVPVDDYRADVERDARRAGVPLRRRNRGPASVRFLPHL